MKIREPKQFCLKKIGMKFFYRIVASLTIYLFLFPAHVGAQISSSGKTFYMSFMQMEVRTGSLPDTLLIFVTSEVNTSLVLDNPRVAGSNQTVKITAGRVNRIEVDKTYYYPLGSEFGSSDVNSKKGLRIVAKDLINVYCMNLEYNRSDATFVMPYESIPPSPEFFVCSFPPNATINSNYSESEFVVIGMDNNVKVEITPTATTKGGNVAGTAYTVTLNKGQVYQVQSKSSDGSNNTDPAATSWSTTGALKGDLTGTRVRVIEGCGKINVFSGSRSAHVTKGNCGSGLNGRDHLYTQVIPTLALGKNYILMPFFGQVNGYVYKVVAAYDSTDVYIDGTLSYTILKKGQWIYQNVGSAKAVCIKTSKQAYVVQYMKNGACSGLGGTNGDPAILIMPDINQRLLKTLVGTATTSNMNKHYVNILIDKGAKNSVKLNGKFMAASSFTDVTCDGKYSYALVSVANPSSNAIECDSGFVAVAYGVGPYESYSYSAGALFENVNYDIKLTRKTQCPGEDVKLEAVVAGNPKIKGYIWNFGDGSAIDTGKTVKHKFSRIGTFYVVVKIPVQIQCGSVDTIIRSKIITVKQGPILYFTDTTTQCASAINLTITAPYTNKFIYKWHDSTKLKTFTAVKEGKVWLKITDTSTNCVSIDSTIVRRADAIIAAISFDSLDMCYKTNKFVMRDGTKYNKDSRKTSLWRIKDNYKGLFGLGTYFYSDSVSFRYKFDTISKNELRYIVQSKKGCADTLDTMLVVYPYPLAKIASSGAYFCQNQKISLFDSSQSNEGVGKSIWLYGNGVTDTVAPYKAVYTYKIADTFTVRLITITPFGCRDTADSTFIVRPAPINKIDVNKKNICFKANEFDFTDKSTIVSGSYTSEWRYGINSTATSSMLKSVKFTDTGWYLVILKNTSDFGCTDIDTAKVFVAPEPKANFIVTDSNACYFNHFFSFEDASKVPTNAKLNPRSDWKYQDGTSNFAKSVPNKTFPAVGKYWVRIIATTTDGCKDSFQRNIEIFVMPKADISSSASQCLVGNKFIFKQKFPWTGGSNVTHSWKISDGKSSTLDSFSHTFGAVGKYRVFHSIETESGCYDSVSVVVSVVETPKTSFTTSKDTACLTGHKFTFTDNTVFGSSYTSRWTLADGTFETTKNVTNKEYLNPGKYDVKLVLSSSSGCRDSLTKSVNVWPFPKSNFTVNNPEQCLIGNAFTFTNTTSENSASGVAYAWLLNKAILSSIKTIPSQTFPDTGNYSITLKALSDKGCGTEKTLLLRVNEHPSLSISGKNACAEIPIQFSSIAKINRGTIVSYDWNFGDGFTANTANPMHAYSKEGNYNVVLQAISNKGCGTKSPQLSILVSPKPIADFDFEYLLSRGLETDWKFTFTGKNTDAYNWLFQDNQTSTSGLPFFMTFSGTGDFKVRLEATNNSGCSDTIEKNIFLKPELLWWLPNAFSPNIDGLNEEFKPYQSFGISKYRMTILNRWGEILFSTTDPAMGWKGLDKLGKPVLEGSYAYAVSFRYIDGKMNVFKGTVTVLR